MSNARATHTKTILGVMKSLPFVTGFNEVRMGLRLRSDAFLETNDQWSYERGRQLAAIFDGPLKYRHTVNRRAAAALADAIRCKFIF